MWNVEWNALSARIASLMEAGTYLANLGRDDFASFQKVFQNAIDLKVQIGHFRDNYGSQLPEPAGSCLARFANEQLPELTRGLPGMHAALILLASFRAEFSYLLIDSEAVGRSLVVRAFTHLQRSIVADEVFGDRWRAAFNKGETACEKLGACHLLLHGVWAFKASAQGERTDLILGTPLAGTNLSEVRAAADALVLTEWKKVETKGELDGRAEQAYEQARRYSSGILAGYELSSRRYLVMVSSDFLQMPNPREDRSVLYEYVNVAVSPSSPCHV
jgi:hypothetical protein